MEMILHIFRVVFVVLGEDPLWNLSELLPFTSTILSCSERWICYKDPEYGVTFCMADIPSPPLTPHTHLQPSQQLGYQKHHSASGYQHGTCLSKCRPFSFLPFIFLSSSLFFLPSPFSYTFPLFIFFFFLRTGVSTKLWVWHTWKF